LTLQSYGLELSDIITDGKIHRFDYSGDKNGWYVAYKNNVNLVVTIGDWKTGEKECLVFWDSLENPLEQIWNNAATGVVHEYLKRKGIKEDLGTRTKIEGTERVLYVPVRNIHGGLQSIQKIWPSGEKKFLPGHSTKGGMFVIGGPLEGQIFICEGIATGATIHMATQRPVVCAFNAGNIPVVVDLIKSTHKNIDITVCADNDQFGEVNVGIQKAKESGEKVLVPEFQDLSDQPTDYNDLMQKQGLEEVKSQIMKKDEFTVRCLGHKDGRYYYISNYSKEVLSIGQDQHRHRYMTALMPLEYWETYFPAKKYGVDWTRVDNELKRACHEMGSFKTDIIRGRGVWRDNGRIVFNYGTGICVDGVCLDPFSFESDFIYEIGKAISPPSVETMNIGDKTTFLDSFMKLPWKSSDIGRLMAGWLVVAPFAGALDWRPHIWITGPSGSGKSTIMKYIQKIIGQYCQVIQGNSTEAGVRQFIRSNCLPLIFDEFETDSKKSANRVEATIEFIRQASSETQGQVVRGTPTGKHLSFGPRFCACVASIRVNLQIDADRNRFTLMELGRPMPHNEWVQVDRYFYGLPKKFDNIWLSTFYKNLPAILENIKTFKTILTEQHTARFADQHSPMLAGYAQFINEGVLSEVDARALVGTFKLNLEEAELDSSDENQCLDHILNSLVRYNGQDARIIDLIRVVLKNKFNDDAQAVLRNHGIKAGPDFLYIANRSPALKKLLKDTQWESCYAKILKRVPGADNNDNKAVQIFKGEAPTKCTRVKTNYFFME
jgi:putative DNA primase/helicase